MDCFRSLKHNTQKDTKYYIYLLILNKHWCDATSLSSELVTGSHSVLTELSDGAWRVSVGIFAIAETLLAIQSSPVFSQNEMLYINFTTSMKTHYTFRSLMVFSLPVTLTYYVPQQEGILLKQLASRWTNKANIHRTGHDYAYKRYRRITAKYNQYVQWGNFRPFCHLQILYETSWSLGNLTTKQANNNRVYNEHMQWWNFHNNGLANCKRCTKHPFTNLTNTSLMDSRF